jgi:LysR family glycine cleavage system transcriptional activator
MRKLPSFQALKAFEATVRAGSLSGAARELNVTPGAVSRQISALEERLGRPLMLRHAQGITPTRAGSRLTRSLTEAFDMVEAAVLEAEAGTGRETLVLNLYPTLAIQWLAPRLAVFHSVAPEVDLQIRTSLIEPRFIHDDVDVAILIGQGNWPGLEAHLLFPRLFTLVASPALLERLATDPASALRASRPLYSDLHIGHWRQWLAAAGLDDLDLTRGTLFENSSLAYQAARDGAGFALGQTHLLAEDLKTGRLVAPFETVIRGERQYYIAHRRTDAGNPAIRKLVDWAVSEACEDG